VRTSIPNKTYRGVPHQPQIGCPLVVWGGPSNLWIDITSAVRQLATGCLILWISFRDQAIQWRHSRDRGSKGRCHGNQFWDYVSCKWTLTGDNDTRLSYEGWFVFIQPLRLYVARCLWIRSCGDRNCSRRATVRLGIDTLIANILVIYDPMVWTVTRTDWAWPVPADLQVSGDDDDDETWCGSGIYSTASLSHGLLYIYRAPWLSQQVSYISLGHIRQQHRAVIKGVVISVFILLAVIDPSTDPHTHLLTYLVTQLFMATFHYTIQVADLVCARPGRRPASSC